jgi:hypothetical protein
MHSGTGFTAVVIGLLASACAPAGQHYGSWSAADPASAFTVYPNDPCRRAELQSPGALSHLNAKVGQPDGPSRKVTSLNGLTSGFGNSGGSIVCHGTIVFDNGDSESGTVAFIDYVGTDSFGATWESDAQRERRQDTPTRRAIRRFCATATPLACSLYVSQATRCEIYGSNGYTILLSERAMISAGATPVQAAELAIDSHVKVAAGALDDLVSVAQRALTLPDEETPGSFRDNLLQECLAVTGRANGHPRK